MFRIIFNKIKFILDILFPHTILSLIFYVWYQFSKVEFWVYFKSYAYGPNSVSDNSPESVLSGTLNLFLTYQYLYYICFIIYTIFFLLVCVLHCKKLLKKEKIKNHKVYFGVNFLQWIILLMITFV